MGAFWDGWISSESADHDAIKVKRVYIDINDGNAYDAILFSQIMYWHGLNRETGKPRMTLERDGEMWLAKTYDEWWDECRIKPAEARKCIGRMVKRGLLIKKVWKFKGRPTVHLRVNVERFELVMNFHVRQYVDPICYVVADSPSLNATTYQVDLLQRSDLYTETTAETTKTETVVADAPTPPTASKKEASNAWYDAVLAVWGYTGARNGAMAKLLRGEATAKGYREYNLTTPLTEPGQVLAWRDWYRHVKGKGRADTIIVAKPEKVQSSIGEWQLSLSKPAAPPVVYHRAPTEPRVYEGPSPEQIKADLARVRAEMAATGRANGARH